MDNKIEVKVTNGEVSCKMTHPDEATWWEILDAFLSQLHAIGFRISDKQLKEIHKAIIS